MYVHACNRIIHLGVTKALGIYIHFSFTDLTRIPSIFTENLQWMFVFIDGKRLLFVIFYNNMSVGTCCTGGTYAKDLATAFQPIDD